METWAGTLKHSDITENEVKDEPLAFTWSPDDRLWEPTVHDTLGCFSRHAQSALIERFLINVWGNKKNICLCGFSSSPTELIDIQCLFSLVHLCRVHFFSWPGRGRWQDMWQGWAWWASYLGSRSGQQACEWHAGGGREGGSSSGVPHPWSARYHPLTTFPPSLLIVRRRSGSPQMLMSLTSVGVQDKSASSSTRLVSVVPLCCCACRRLDSSRDSICSWHDRKQSCKHRIETESRPIALQTSNKWQNVSIPGRYEWPATGN